MYLSIARKQRHASPDRSSLPRSFLRSGCLMGSLEYLHNSSCRLRLALESDNVLERVRFGGGLKLQMAKVLL